jgi:hypothetical protein
MNRYRDRGVDRVVPWLPSGPSDEVLAVVDDGSLFAA